MFNYKKNIQIILLLELYKMITHVDGKKKHLMPTKKSK